MALILWLLVALIPYLMGKGALRILYRNRPTQEWNLSDYVLTGWIISMGLAEAAHLGAVIMGWSFSRVATVWGIGVIVCTIAALLISFLGRENRKTAGNNKIAGNRKNTRSDKNTGNSKNTGNRITAENSKIAENSRNAGKMGGKLPWILFGVAALTQVMYVMTMQEVYTQGDMTLESVISFLASDRIYEINPLTGNAYTQGMPLRLKILCLPTVYAALVKGFGVDAESLVYGMIPAFVLLGSYLAYYTLAKQLFRKDLFRQGVFMAIVAILYSFGDYMYGVDGFGVLHSGFRGVTIRAAILLPYTLGLMLRKKYKLVLLCILAEACIVWTFYGMGACLLMAAGLMCVEQMMKYFEKKKGREEDAACRNS